MCRIIFSSFLLLICSAVLGENLNDVRFKEVYLSSGEVAVVSEGSLEPRSVGSYALKIYSVDNPKFIYDNFITGVIRKRDGVLERAIIYDFDKNGTDEIVIIIRSAGSGGYVSADAFKYDNNKLSLLMTVKELNKDSNPIHALELAIKGGT